jgi:hypothetical protein
MVEYGNGISQGPGGQVGGSGGGGGGVTSDWGVAIGHAVNDAVHTVAALPPWQLALLVILVIAGLVILKRAF